MRIHSSLAAVEDALQRSPSLATARITEKSRDGFVTLGVTGVENAIRITDRRWRA